MCELNIILKLFPLFRGLRLVLHRCLDLVFTQGIQRQRARSTASNTAAVILAANVAWPAIANRWGGAIGSQVVGWEGFVDA